MSYICVDCDKRIADEEGSLYDLKYFIMETKYDEFNVYGIGIEKYVDNKLVESEVVENITSSYDDANKIFNKIIDCDVLPMELCYVIDDMFGEYFLEAID